MASWREFRDGYLLLGGHRIDQLPLFSSLGRNREVGEREIFLASSIYSPPRCSFYTTFCYRFRGRGEGSGSGPAMQNYRVGANSWSFRQKSLVAKPAKLDLHFPPSNSTSARYSLLRVIGSLHYSGESLPRFRERRLCRKMPCKNRARNRIKVKN